MSLEFRPQFFKVIVMAVPGHVSSQLFEFIPVPAEHAECSQAGPCCAEEGQAAHVQKMVVQDPQFFVSLEEWPDKFQPRVVAVPQIGVTRLRESELTRHVREMTRGKQ